jgi:transcriptional regulator with XRE-family HTH domain
MAFQIRALRDREKWTQAEFAEKVGIKHQPMVSSRLENSHYGKHSITTLKKIAAACDVALVVWFIPFSRLTDWVIGKPYLDEGLSSNFYDIPAFDKDPGLMPATATIKAGPIPEDTQVEQTNPTKVASIDRDPARKFGPMSDLGSIAELATGRP